MAVLAASNNNGRYNNVHRQTDDGLVISVVAGDNLMPLVFRYKNYLGCFEESLLSSAFYPHARLMRGDCGWVEENDSSDLLFSWENTIHVTDGLSAGPSNEFVENYHEIPDNAHEVRLDGLSGRRTVYSRKDRTYWTPDNTLQAVAPEPLFGWTQWNPMTCPPTEPDNCGLVQFYPKCSKKTKFCHNVCCGEGDDLS